MSEKGDIFWIKDPTILFREKNYLNFFPKKDMTKTQKLNTMTVYSIYLFILLLLFADNSIWFYIPVIIIIICICMNYINDKETNELVNNNIHEIEDENIHKKEVCQKPTKENPYMNVVVSDYYNNPDRPVACDVENKEIKEEMKSEYYQDLYRNVSDLYEKDNSERQFYTMPNTTIPNNQKQFAEWLFKTKETCKYDSINCLEFEDERYH